jgi:hypothetical protein
MDEAHDELYTLSFANSVPSTNQKEDSTLDDSILSSRVAELTLYPKFYLDYSEHSKRNLD